MKTEAYSKSRWTKLALDLQGDPKYLVVPSGRRHAALLGCARGPKKEEKTQQQQKSSPLGPLALRVPPSEEELFV